MKKRKLNSKNPKHQEKSQEKEQRLLKKIPLTGKASGHAIFYANDK